MFEESQENEFQENLSPMEMELLNSIITQYKPPNPDEKLDEDISKITYNDYYKTQGIN